MNTLTNNHYDAIEQIIFEEDLQIKTVDIHPELDVMLIILNTRTVLRQTLSAYPQLKNALAGSLLNYKLIANGTGIHWPDLDEDLSLKGFLSDELKKVVK